MGINNLITLEQRFDNVVLELENIDSTLARNLNEKGVECALLVPLIETALGFDALKDINYEVSSMTQNNQRFDFLLEDCFLIEAKALNIDIKKNKSGEQIRSYIEKNDNINFGFLSNGFDYIFYIQKSYMKSFLTGTEELLVPIKNEVLPVFSIAINNDYFWDIIKLFSKDTYKVHFERIAKYVLSKYKQGYIKKIADSKEINEIIKQLIDKTVVVKKGYYFESIQSNEMTAGTTLSYIDDNIKIKIIVEDNGTVKLLPENIEVLNMTVVKDSAFAPIIDLVLGSWGSSPQIFDSPDEIIRMAMNRLRLSASDKIKYTFS